MRDSVGLSITDLSELQQLVQRVTAARPELINADASFGELVWNWGLGVRAAAEHWRLRRWYAGGELIGWAWATLPYEFTRRDGSPGAVTDAYLVYQLDHRHAPRIEDVIGWYAEVAPGVDHGVIPSASDEFAVARWRAAGYVDDPDALGELGSWTAINRRDLVDLDDLDPPALPVGWRFDSAATTQPAEVVQVHRDAWPRSNYSVEDYVRLREAPGYRADLHLLIMEPDGRPVSSVIMWLDEANRTVEFEPMGTHPDFRRRGLGRALMLHGLRQARAAGAVEATVVCLGAPGHPSARGLYEGVGFRPYARDRPLIKSASPS